LWPADRLRDPKRGLPALLQDVSRKGSKTIKEALELLDHIELLQWSVDELWEDLDDNRALHAKNLARFSNDKPGCDQVAAVFALSCCDQLPEKFSQQFTSDSMGRPPQAVQDP
jgi:chloramphenicol 3-O-phosphotransferase